LTGFFSGKWRVCASVKKVDGFFWASLEGFL
jgi:hypothetical protein